MNRHRYIYALLMMLAISATAVWTISSCSDNVKAKTSAQEKYTEKQPLVVISDLDFPPYEYRSDEGDAIGFNIELIDKVLNKLHIPYVVKMYEWQKAVEVFNNREADIIFAPTQLKLNHAYYSKNAISQYKACIVYKKGTKKITKLSDITKDHIVAIKSGDYTGTVVASKLDKSTISFSTPKNAVISLQKGNIDYFIYGERPMKWLIESHGITNIEIAPIDIPSTSMRIIGHDKRLLAELDDQLTRLEQYGELEELTNIWFYPEKVGTNAVPTFLIIILGILLLAIVTLQVSRYTSKRIKKTLQESYEINDLMSEALKMSENCVIKIDSKTHKMYNVHGNHIKNNGCTIDEYIKEVYPDDQEATRKYGYAIVSNANMVMEHEYRWNSATAEHPVWRYIFNRSIPEFDIHGNLINTISTLIDITDSKEKEILEMEMSYKYGQIFEKSIVGLALFDSDGNMLNANNTMKNIMGTRKEIKMSRTNMFDIPSIKECLNNNNMQQVHFCTRFDITDNQKADYLEIKIRAIRDEHQKLIYYMMTVIDKDMERCILMQNRKYDQQIRNINLELNKYNEQLKYLLAESKMKVWRYSIKEQKIILYDDFTKISSEIDKNTFLEILFKEHPSYNLVKKMFADEIVHDVPSRFVICIENKEDLMNEFKYHAITNMCEYDDYGNYIGRFGLVRDITHEINAQNLLKDKAAKAQDSGRQKSAFLANMSHEIRTPLNAIVGFCDLLDAVDEPEEKAEFIRIIRTNCDLLVQLINDILVTSTMDMNGQDITPERIDIAPWFNDLCMSLAQRVSAPEVLFIKDNPYDKLVTTLDKMRIQQVITNFVTNAVKYTQTGHIKVGIKVKDNGLFAYCEDTGTGIPEDKQDSIFERFVKLNSFVQGTGLGLSICKTIIEKCKGRIGVKSQEGQGSTFWFWVPCKIENVSTNSNGGGDLINSRIKH